jgi:hypothetical protein
MEGRGQAVSFQNNVSDRFGRSRRICLWMTGCLAELPVKVTAHEAGSPSLCRCLLTACNRAGMLPSNSTSLGLGLMFFDLDSTTYIPYLDTFVNNLANTCSFA